ncbi:hypothetical protein H4P46_14360 [Escherichia coli]|nr:hypothetical protein H4P46_14360 [Escherichia coli]
MVQKTTGYCVTPRGANELKEEVVSRCAGENCAAMWWSFPRSRDGGMESGIRGVNPDTGNSDNTMKADNPAMPSTGGLWKWGP